MSDFELPAVAAEATPEFVDPEACKAWLGDVPLANVGAAQSALLAELQEFNRFPTKAANRLAGMGARRRARAEAAVFPDTSEVGEQPRLGYLRCLGAALGGDAALRAQAGLIC